MKNLQTFLIFLSLMVQLQNFVYSKGKQVYAITQDFPMNDSEEQDRSLLKKNYFIDMGLRDGVEVGQTLHVYRKVSVLNPYANQERMNHLVKIAEVVVKHSEERSSIVIQKPLNSQSYLAESDKIQIGDIIQISVK